MRGLVKLIVKLPWPIALQLIKGIAWLETYRANRLSRRVRAEKGRVAIGDNELRLELTLTDAQSQAYMELEMSRNAQGLPKDQTAFFSDTMGWDIQGITVTDSILLFDADMGKRSISPFLLVRLRFDTKNQMLIWKLTNGGAV